jgi:tetratricopeptide (TPR) repeat protein
VKAHWLSLAVIVALSVCLRATAAEPRIDKYVKYDTGDFVVLTSRGGAQARDFMQNLTRFRVALEKILGKRAARSGIATHIFITSTRDWEKYLMPREQAGGFFQRSRFENYMALEGDAGDYALYVMFHEYTHFYLSSQFAGEYPPWFNEGLAELMAYAKFKGNRVILQIPGFRLDEARDRDWIPFERLIKVSQSSPEYQNHKLADAFYAQAWLTVHYGLVEERAFGRQIIDYLTQVNSLVPQEEAMHKAFGDLDAIDHKLRAYSRNRQMLSGAVDLGDVPEVSLPAPQPLEDTEALAALIDVMLEAHIAPARTRPLVESLKRRAPESARSYILAARLAQFDDDLPGFDAAIDKAEVFLDDGDWRSRREFGSALLSRSLYSDPLGNRKSEDDERDLRRAAKRLGEAVNLNQEDAEALWGLGSALSRLDRQLDLADTALQAAYARVPASAAIAMSLAELKGREQKPEEMIPFLKDTIRYADNLSTRQWATDTLESTQKYIAERAAVEAENKKQHEKYEKDLADYEKKYGKVKKQKKTG